MNLRFFRAGFSPDSLALRTVLLVIAVVMVAQITTFSLLFQARVATHKHQTVRYIVGQVRLLQATLPRLDEESRRRLEEAEPGEQWLQLRPDDGQVPDREPRSGFARALARDLRQTFGEAISFRQPNHDHDARGGLWIGFYAGGERWWLVLPALRFKPHDLPWELWLKLGIALAALILIAGLFVRGIVRPLRQLGDAVSATGAGSARRVAPSGPREVRRLAERHNTMLEQLALAEDERREMLAGLTHDLRAPLARLRVRLALLENEAQRGGLERDAEDMERIVDQCLDFLRSEARQPESVEVLLLADAVSDEVARHRELGHLVDIVVSADATACGVSIARGDLKRLLDNLITNALRHGTPPVEVSLSGGHSGWVVLGVRDHGPGIPEGERKRVLEAFAQLDPARATRGSCGLGLAIVRRIVESAGGTLELIDAPGGGLAVRMVLRRTSD
ncbi:MAG: HAMP domain-containing protein [Candidatus Accumulibacter sp.]|jgi:two-component system osmolarity sensor histidine kinase EnvZ|nr:HAMP domain-containing protein [Accumulibacter sp.]